MADRPMIVGPDGRTPASMRNLRTNIDKATNLQADKPINEGRAAELIAAGIIVGLHDIVVHFRDENERMMIQMEETVYARVLSDIKRRSILGRVKLRWRAVKEWARPWLIEAGAADPLEKPDHLKLEESNATAKATH